MFNQTSSITVIIVQHTLSLLHKEILKIPNMNLSNIFSFNCSVQTVRTKEEKEVLEHFAGVVRTHFNPYAAAG